MNDEAQPIVLHILGKEYRVVCPSGEEEALLTAARYLSKKMEEVKSSGKIIGVERVAVMTALNIAHELLQEHSRKEGERELNERIQTLRHKVEAALEECRQIDAP
jgi:cell division protein ZapA